MFKRDRGGLRVPSVLKGVGSFGGPVGSEGMGVFEFLVGKEEVRVVGVPLSWEGVGTFGVPVGVGARGRRGCGPGGCWG